MLAPLAGNHACLSTDAAQVLLIHAQWLIHSWRRYFQFMGFPHAIGLEGIGNEATELGALLQGDAGWLINVYGDFGW